MTVDYLADRLAVYLDEFVQSPPYHMVGSSLGCQVILLCHRLSREGLEASADLPVRLPRR